MTKKQIKDIEQLMKNYEYEEYDAEKKAHTFIKNGWWEHWRLWIYDSGKIEIIYLEEHENLKDTLTLTPEGEKAIKDILRIK